MKNWKNYLARTLVFIAGTLAVAFGVAFAIKGNLGTSPISSFPYALSLITPLTVGTATIAMHVGFVSLQMLILRKKYSPLQLSQLAASLLFGYCVDFAMRTVAGIDPTTYLERWAACGVGIVLVGVGIFFQVKARITILAGEGLILAIRRVVPAKFSSLKIGFDATLVALACATTPTFLGTIAGVREGTVAAAFLVGVVVKICERIYRVARRRLGRRSLYYRQAS